LQTEMLMVPWCVPAFMASNASLSVAKLPDAVPADAVSRILFAQPNIDGSGGSEVFSTDDAAASDAKGPNPLDQPALTVMAAMMIKNKLIMNRRDGGFCVNIILVSSRFDSAAISSDDGRLVHPIPYPGRACARKFRDLNFKF